jgi:thiamine-phosphate pyrophosphorylase
MLPKLYAIADTALAGERAEALIHEWLASGVRLMQYRHKGDFTRAQWEACRRIAAAARQCGATFIVNDRADIALMCGAAGVHVGQEDLPPDAVRRVAGQQLIVGFSTHNETQARDADSLPVDYVAIGPVFATATKLNPDPVIGLEGVAAARRATSKPLVAIGGITRANFRQVLAAGADSVAVVRDLLAPGALHAFPLS